MRSLIFATHNTHKVAEIAAWIPQAWRLQSLTDLDWDIDLPETRDSLEGNAAQKAETLHQASGCDTLADDTGLQVNALDGAPGVFSARFAGPGATDADNVQWLLNRLEGVADRSAHFKTVICLILDGQRQFFEGRLDGVILEKPRGQHGFGYDPVFLPNGTGQSLAEMTAEQKNQISHRAQAMHALSKYLQNIPPTTSR